MFTVTPLIFGINGWEWVIIVLVILLLFGGRKIPELMRGLGKGVKELKKGMKEADAELQDIKKELESDDKK
ncbi:MAG: twin-arginine translocase TatA/TatE family subunit [Bacteroidales bacterium]|nr:twin-arginine translocase TatA/TatE family subunit [Bacteroidales bacterium]